MTLKTVRVIIYDLDGVLVDSRRANAAFYNHILEHFGLPGLSAADLTLVNTLTSNAALEHLFRNSPWRQAALEYQYTVDNRPLLPLLRVEPQARETLTALRPRYGTALATNRGRSTGLVLAHVGLADCFDLIISSVDVEHPKPHPESLLRVLEHFQAGPEVAVSIGDSEVDQETAARAGVPFIAYKNPSLAASRHLEEHGQMLEWLGLPRG